MEELSSAEENSQTELTTEWHSRLLGYKDFSLRVGLVPYSLSTTVRILWCSVLLSHISSGNNISKILIALSSWGSL